MPEYKYMTVAPNGRFVWHVLNADSAKSLEADLLVAQIPVIEVVEKSRKEQASRKSVPLKDLSTFTQQMETGFGISMPLPDLLASCIECTTHPFLKTVATTIKADIENGSGIAKAMAQWPRVFDTIYLSFVTAGEESGILDKTFGQLKAMLVRNQIIRSKFRSVMMMPIMTLVVALLVVAFMLTAIVPKFVAAFSGAGVALPGPTQLLVTCSNSIAAHPWISGGLFIALIGALINCSGLVRHLPSLHGMVLKIPIFGQLQRKTMQANFARTLAQLLDARVPFVDALYLTRDISTNVVYRLAVAQAIIAVANGAHIAEALQTLKPIFGAELLNQISFGERSGSVAKLLEHISTRLDRELVTSIDDMKPVLDALMPLLIGCLVGPIILALYLPMIQMGATIK